MPVPVYIILLGVMTVLNLIFWLDSPPNTSKRENDIIRSILGVILLLMLIPIGFIASGKEVIEKEEIEVYQIKNRLYYFNPNEHDEKLYCVNGSIVVKDGTKKLLKTTNKTEYVVMFEDYVNSVVFSPIENNQ